MPFKCTSLTMLQNEADILEYFVRANLRLLDHMVIVVNPSSDGSEDILDVLSGEGLPITVWRTGLNHYSQGDMLSWFATNLRDRLAPDYLFLMDADEILLAASKETLVDALNFIPEDHVGSVYWRTFLPEGIAKNSCFTPNNFRNRLSKEIMPIKKLIIPSKTAIHETHPFAHGTHTAYGPNRKGIPITPISGIEIAHLPVRSHAQIREKAAASTLSRVIAHGTEWHGKESFQYGLVWKMLEQNPVPDIREIAMRYLDRSRRKIIPAPVRDERLPDIPTSLADCKSARDENELYFQLVNRLFKSSFPISDPTKALKKALDQKVLVEANNIRELPAGAFSALQHAQSLKCDWPPIEQALARFKPNQMLDLGCGLGAYLYQSERENIDVFGIDGSPWSELHLISENKYLQHDLSEGPPSLDKRFDLSMCLEVLEHLPEKAGLEIVEWLSEHSKNYIVFSAARPKQPGHRHITCRKPEFWLDAFSKFGWSADPASTASLRLTSTFHWFRCNIFVLRPGKQKDAQGLAHLQSLSHPVRRWPDHGKGAKLIGFAGQHRSFTLDAQREIPPLPAYTD